MSRVIQESVLSSGKDNIHSEQLKGKLFLALCIAAILFGLFALSALLIYVFRDAVGWLNWQFITSPPSRFASKAGVYPMLLGSSFVILLVAIFSLPLGVGAAVYLEEYA